MPAKFVRWLAALLIAALVTACNAPAPATPTEATEEPTEAATEETVEPTEEVTELPPTETPIPEPTDTPAPTETPTPDYITTENARDVAVINTFFQGDTSTALTASAFSPDSTEVATYGWSKVITIWDLEREAVAYQMTGSAEWGMALEYSPDGTLIVSGGTWDYTVRMWDAEDHSLLYEIRANAWVRRVRFNADGSLIAVAGNQNSRLQIYNAQNGQEVKVLQPTGVQLAAAAFSPDGRYLAAVDVDSTVVVYDAETYSEVTRLTPGQVETAADIEFSPNSDTLALGSNHGRNGHISIWNTSDWSLKNSIQAHPESDGVFDLEYAKDGDALMSGGGDGRLLILDVESGAQLASLSLNKTIWSISLSGDGTKAALAMDNGDLIIIGLPE